MYEAQGDKYWLLRNRVGVPRYDYSSPLHIPELMKPVKKHYDRVDISLNAPIERVGKEKARVAGIAMTDRTSRSAGVDITTLIRLLYTDDLTTNMLNSYLKSRKELLMLMDPARYDSTVEERNRLLIEYFTDQNFDFISAIKELREIEKAPPKRKQVHEIKHPSLPKSPRLYMASEDPF